MDSEDMGKAEKLKQTDDYLCLQIDTKVNSNNIVFYVSFLILLLRN
jgi:hypothetical protein